MPRWNWVTWRVTKKVQVYGFPNPLASLDLLVALRSDSSRLIDQSPPELGEFDGRLPALIDDQPLSNCALVVGQ
jgi:hypothetical protein